MLKINTVSHCYSNLFKCYWRVFVPSRLLAAPLMFEEAVPASTAVSTPFSLSHTQGEHEMLNEWGGRRSKAYTHETERDG